jgi:hypothetical protein
VVLEVGEEEPDGMMKTMLDVATCIRERDTMVAWDVDAR